MVGIKILLRNTKELWVTIRMFSVRRHTLAEKGQMMQIWEASEAITGIRNRPDASTGNLALKKPLWNGR